MKLHSLECAHVKCYVVAKATY